MGTHFFHQRVPLVESLFPGVPGDAYHKRFAYESAILSDYLGSRLSTPTTSVVGVGASAGGLEAFTQLLTGIPVDTGMAYLLVQHLDPTHESALTELLARSSPIPVLQARDGMRIDANQAYVIPPNAAMTLINGHIKLAPRNKISHPPSVIDEFFRSVADVRGNRAVGIVLSGSGSDGALGVKAIRNAGGITLVQEPSSAAYDSMPLAAIATGCADFILPPNGIAALMGRVGQQVNLHPQGTDEPLQEAEGIVEILQVLRKRTGVDFSQYKRGTIQRRLLRRMFLRKIDTPLEYVSLMRSELDEVDTLYNDLLIGVTSFFRDPEVFETLAKEVIPSILKRRASDTPFRIWVAGCSTGEEVYSIAICLLEALGDDVESTKINIFATDISHIAIATARVGCYSAESVERVVSPKRRRRFFVQDKDGYRVNAVLRDLCIFAQQNVTSDPPFSQLDLISCRNLLIYLQPVLHRKLFSTFHFALNPTGVLLLGIAESVGINSVLFSSIDKTQPIYTRCAIPATPLQFDLTELPEEVRPRPKSVIVQQPEASRLVEVQRAADQIIIARATSAGVVVDDHLQIVQFRGRAAAYFEPVSGTATLDLLKMVQRDLLADLRRMIAKARSDLAPAHVDGIPMRHDGRSQSVDLDVIPFKLILPSTQFFLVLFTESVNEDTDSMRSTPVLAASSSIEHAGTGHHESRLIGNLRQELQAQERHLQVVMDDHEAVVESLRLANVEAQLRTEKLQSTAEEFETTKEELQSTNEELTTVNDEVRARNIELGIVNDDLTNLIASIEVPVIMLDKELRIRRFTSGLEQVAHILPSDVGRPLRDLTLNLDIQDLNHIVATVSSTGIPVEHEVRKKGGRWYSMLVRPYKTALRHIDGLVIVFQDIDERKRRSQEIEEARQYAAAIVETVRQPLLVLDGSLRIHTANRAFYEMFQTSASDTFSRSLFELGNGQWDLPRLRVLLENILLHKTSFEQFEVVHVFPIIDRKTMLLHARRLTIHEDGTVFILLAIEDITVRKNSEMRARFLETASMAVRASLDYDTTLRVLATLSVPAFADWCMIDVQEADGSWRRANMVFRDQTTTSDSTFLTADMFTIPGNPVFQVGQTSTSFLAEEVSEALLKTLVHDPDQLAQIRILNPQSIIVVPLSVNNQASGAITFVTTSSGQHYTQADLELAEELGRRASMALEHIMLYRETSEARDAAETANRVKSEFLATMSHELRTPLNAILGYAQLLQMELRGPINVEQRQDLERIEYSQQHLSYLINGILDFVKIGAGRMTFTIVDISIDQILQETDALIMAQMVRKGIHYHYRPCDSNCRVVADVSRLQQIVVNLLSNAIKYTSPDGTIVLAYDTDDLHVNVHVTDNGVGIPGDKLETIFEPFMQLDNTLTRAADGTGLGLSISRELARGMGGDIQVTSVVGEGSTFTLMLLKSTASLTSNN